MAEYWKSTPKYWCKFCETFVRDTPFEKRQHEATGRHQNSIQRSLRRIHKENEREERDKQRAKDEVARLNGTVGGGSSAAGLGWKQPAPAPSTAAPKPASEEDRKRQLAQLASLGVAMPDQARKDMAMAGEWQTVSETVIVPKKLGQDVKSEGSGMKRKADDRDRDDEEEEPAPKKGWGSTFKTYPGSKGKGGEEIDIEALLGGAPKIRVKSEDAPVKKEDAATPEIKTEDASPEVKPEDPGAEPSASAVPTEEEAAGQNQKPKEPETPESEKIGVGIVFKKRKSKAAKPR